VSNNEMRLVTGNVPIIVFVHSDRNVGGRLFLRFAVISKNTGNFITVGDPCWLASIIV